MATILSVVMLSRTSWAATYGVPTRKQPVKDGSEVVSLLFDFSPVTASVSGIAISVWVDRDASDDAAPGQMLHGAPSISEHNPAVVAQRIGGGQPDNDYGFRCVVTGSDGEALVMQAIVPVRNLPQFYTPPALAGWNDTLAWDDTMNWIEA